ncbi:hydantoinase B/oxoprolinase family protein [Brevibacterium album]|uniref:hydantoinase B/oxoprolinase family protein n=1 Tax=Brevibacterium album TaxID=417948 RepID=UPI000420ECAE|nr:hydantoinase B/oxoprolinase family protein [Brevibacterium album]
MQNSSSPQAAASGLRVGIDIGGTFTDLSVLDADGIVAVGKVLTTHGSPAAGVVDALDRVLGSHRLDPARIEWLVHGTTLVTNALIERRGARTALLTTAGFRDVVEMGREHRYDLYDLEIEMPVPLVPRSLRIGVPERILASGEVAEPLDEEHLLRAVRELQGAGVEAVAVCFLHAHVNPAHERHARRLIEQAAPGLRVALSSDINPEVREYERFSTTLANVYVQGVVEDYLAELEAGLTRLGVRDAPMIMLSNGGVTAIEVAQRFPIRMLESGPAGGALGAIAFGRNTGDDDLLAFDMGGTTAKLCMIEDGRPLLAHTFEVGRSHKLRPGSGLPVRAPVIDMIEIGAGGGSIARVNSLGLITVGPDSAGSDPGPVCYGQGGTAVTVTDADLLLGLLDPGSFLGGRMALDREAAAEAIREQIAEPLGISVEEAAWGVHATVNANMADAARVHAIERGRELEHLPLFVSGGNGPLHGPGVAQALGSPAFLAPPAAGVLSTLGFLSAPPSIDVVRSRFSLVEPGIEEAAEAAFAELEREAGALLLASGVLEAEVTHQRSADMRFSGQGAEVEVPLADGARPTAEALEAAFRAVYAQRFGEVAPTGVGIEVLNWRVRASGPEPDQPLRFADAAGEGLASAAGEGTEASAAEAGAPGLGPASLGSAGLGSTGNIAAGSRAVYLGPETGFRDVPVYARRHLGSGFEVSGPALIEETESTLFVPVGASARMGGDQTVRVTFGASPSQVGAAASRAESASVDPVVVGLVAGRLHSILDEQQSALISTAFSPVVRESYDLACAVFDSRGRMIGQSTSGTPGHINAMATGMEHIAARFPAEELADGDVLITNDPWMTAGQINDLTIATPFFRAGRLVAWFASCCHSPDIGGRILSAEAREVYEEGLRIPIMKLRTAAGPNAALEELIRANVRTPDETMGDIYAQIASNQVGARSLFALMDEHGLDEIDAVAAEIMDRSERALRERIGQLADGRYTAAMETDGFGGEPLLLAVTVTVEGEEIGIDYVGSSPQSRYGINVVLNYTRAYTSFAIKAALAPEVPHNAGAFRPVTTTAPAGSVLNCLEPAPVASRHLVGHFLPSLVFEALRPAVPEGLPAASADALWMTVWRGLVGEDAEAGAGGAAGDAASAAGGGGPAHFTLTAFGAGGSGGRPRRDGLTTTGFPTGVRAAPTEVLETLTPIVQVERELRPDSAGAGLHRGGLGQRIRVRRRGKGAWSVNANVDRVDFPAPGALDGRDGARGAFTDALTGEPLPRKAQVFLGDDARVALDFPGGGGWGDPRERPVAEVLADVVSGYVTVDRAREEYGVALRFTGSDDALVLTEEMFAVDEEETARLRER